MTKHSNRANNTHSRKNKSLPWINRFMRLASKVTDPRFITYEVVDPYGYACLKPGVSKVYRCEVDSLEPETEVSASISSEVIPLLAFLEDCIKANAIMYRRGSEGFTWCVCDDEVYRSCCEKHGYTDDDFEALHKPTDGD